MAHAVVQRNIRTRQQFLPLVAAGVHTKQMPTPCKVHSLVLHVCVIRIHQK